MELVRKSRKLQKAIERAVLRIKGDEPALKDKSKPDMHDNSQTNKKRKYRL